MQKKFVAVSALLFLLIAVAAPVYAQATRTLQGQVLKGNDAPLSGAVVYLKNTKTLSVRSFTSDDKGNYRFPSLSPNVDYEIYAVHDGVKSDTKTLSAFDSRPMATINLKVNTK
jgi:protocatechuate 3,4-dioxygenase beta subunit